MYAPNRNLRLIHCTQSYHILLHEVAVYFLNCLRFAAAGLQAGKVYVTAPFLPTTLLPSLSLLFSNRSTSWSAPSPTPNDSLTIISSYVRNN